MNTPRTLGIPRGILTAAGLGALVLTTASGCFWNNGSNVASTANSASMSSPVAPVASSVSPTAAASPRGVVDPATVHQQDPAAVAAAWVTDTMAWDTDTDQSPYQANQRALRWTTQTYRVRFGTAAPSSAPGSSWNTAAAHHAYARVSTKVEPNQDAPAPTKTQAYEVLQATATEVGADGWTQAQPPQVWFLSMTRSGSGPWQVNAATLNN